VFIEGHFLDVGEWKMLQLGGSILKLHPKSSQGLPLYIHEYSPF